MLVNGYTELLGSLSIDELLRLKRVLSLVPPVGRIDLDAVVAAMRDPEAARKTAQSSSASPDFERWRSQVSGGRRFELSLTMPLEAADRRYEEEWRRAESLHSGGLSYKEAWAKIRQECRLESSSLGVEDPDDLNDEPAPQRRRTP